MAVQINRMGVIDRLSQGASGKSPNQDSAGTTPNPDPEKPLPLSRRSGGAPGTRGEGYRTHIGHPGTESSRSHDRHRPEYRSDLPDRRPRAPGPPAVEPLALTGGGRVGDHLDHRRA